MLALLTLLACVGATSGDVPKEGVPKDVPADGVPKDVARTLPSADVAPLRVLVLETSIVPATTSPETSAPKTSAGGGKGRRVSIATVATCRATLRTIGGDAEPVVLGELPGGCPNQVTLTWHADRTVLCGAACVDLGAPGPPIPAPPAGTAAVTFDAEGRLHACRRQGVPRASPAGASPVVDHEETDVDAVLDASPDGPAASGGGAWKDGEPYVVDALITDPPEWPSCADGGAFVGGSWAASTSPEWPASAWTPASPGDAQALQALAGGRWYVDPTATVASQGQPDRGPYAVWAGGRWVLVDGTGLAYGLWIADDFVALRGGERSLRVFSRHDGQLAWTSGAGVLAFPWPGAAQAGR